MIEQWRPIAGFETTYEISDQGRLKSLPRLLRDGRMWKGGITSWQRDGKRHWIALQEDCRIRRRMVYQLVAETFLGPYPKGYCINHKNGDPSDDKLENLEYITYKENTQHAIHVLNTIVRGERHGCSRFITAQISELRELWASGKWTQRALAKRYGVTQRAVWQVIHHITWSHV